MSQHPLLGSKTPKNLTGSSTNNWKDLPLPIKQKLAARLKARQDQPRTAQRKLRELIAWRPQPRQAAFLKACGVLEYYLDDGPLTRPVAPLIGYGGAVGGGKTDAFLMLSLILCWAFPRINVTFFRRMFVELEGPDGAIERSRQLFSHLGKYNEQKHRWYFPQVRSYIYFRHCNNEKDKYNYQSQAFHVLLIDEATHFLWSIVDYLITRNRCPSIPEVVPFCVMASNPGNVGHAWYSSVYDLHDHSGGDEGPHEQVKHRLTPNGKYEDVYFIPARLEDNQILTKNDPDYERKLQNREGDLSEALLKGNWRIFQGQAFRAWSRERHVIKPAMVPDWWPKWRAVDWGNRKPFCCLWFTRDPDRGRVYVYRELYSAGLSDRRQAVLIRDLTPANENIQFTYADPSMWTEKNRENITYTTADEYAAEGVILVPADNNRIGGKRKVDRLLEDLSDGKPGLQILEVCQHLIRTLPLLVYDDTVVEDVNTEQEDHAYDALRYGLTNYKIAEPAKDKAEQPQLTAYRSIL